jgi:hypothetical protein
MPRSRVVQSRRTTLSFSFGAILRERFRPDATTQLIGTAAILATLGCAMARPSKPAQHAPCDVPIQIVSTVSLLGSTTPEAQGALTYRGVEYRIAISDWPVDSQSYRGQGTVCGLGKPREIAGGYSIQSGDVWRNQGGVEVHIQPPIAVRPNSKTLNVVFLGAVLPRQP